MSRWLVLAGVDCATMLFYNKWGPSSAWEGVMVRRSDVSIAINRKHLRLFRYLNDAWIFTDLLRPELKNRAKDLKSSTDKNKKIYKVPKGNSISLSKRKDEDIGKIFWDQHERGIFETNIVSMVSRTEAFIQDAIATVSCEYPQKLSVLADKGGIPLDIFLEGENRKDIIRRFVILKCEGLMFGRPSEYLEKTEKILSIELNKEIINKFIEIKASRDIIIHNSGVINKIYVEKAGDFRRGADGDKLVIDHAYFRDVIVTLKKLSGLIRTQIEAVYK